MKNRFGFQIIICHFLKMESFYFPILFFDMDIMKAGMMDNISNPCAGGRIEHEEWNFGIFS